MLIDSKNNSNKYKNYNIFILIKSHLDLFLDET